MRGILCYGLLQADNFQLTPSTVSTYDFLCKMDKVEAVLVHHHAARIKRYHHVIADVRLDDGTRMRCNGYGATPARAHDEAAVRSVIRLIALQPLKIVNADPSQTNDHK